MEIVKGFMRALAGALLFSVPLLLTMELWHIGPSVDRWRLLLLAVATVLLTIGLAHTFGAAKDGHRLRSSLADAAIAVVAGVVVSTAILTLLEVINPLDSWRTAMSVVLIEALPASLGAAFARGQLGTSSVSSKDHSYHHELFLMLGGAVVFSANVAPTEEMVLLAALMDDGNAAVLLGLSLVLMHALVYGSDFAGQEEGAFAKSFLRFTLPGYALALTASAFMLWTLGRFDDTGALMAVRESVVLALPASLGAGAARLIL